MTDTLQDWSVRGYDLGAPLVLTELATNAVLFSPPPYSVWLSFEAGQLRLEVHDPSARLPRPRNYGPEATTGRGLHLVAELCDEWGAAPTETGKMVWATIRPDDQNEMAHADPANDAEDGAGHWPHSQQRATAGQRP